MSRTAMLPTINDLVEGDWSRARRSDPTTSHEAADSTQSSVFASQQYVADLLWLTGPVADHELVERAESDFQAHPHAARWSPQRIRSARAELVRQGRVEFTGLYRRTVSGRRAQIWAVTK